VDLGVNRETLSEWRCIWDGVGPVRVAEELSSPAIGKLVDDIRGEFDKRYFARKWLIETLSKREDQRWWSDFRSWITAAISVTSLSVAVIGLITKIN